MSIFAELRSEVTKLTSLLGMHTTFAKGLQDQVTSLETKVQDEVTSIEDNVKSYVDSKIKDFEDRFFGGVQAQASGAIDKVAADVAALTGSSPAPATSTDPVITTTPDGATVTVLPAMPDHGTAGLTVHQDPASGVTTNVPHDGSTPTATDASGATVTPPPAAVTAAVDASAAAGVTVPG